MENTLAKLLIFAAGCLTGAAISFTVQKKRFEEKLDVEVDEATVELKRSLKKAREQIDGLNLAIDDLKTRPTVTYAKDIVAQIDNIVQAKESIEDANAAVDKELEDDLTIYPITPEEFGANGYEEVQLYFYAADETIADAYDNVIDADDTNVGEDAIDIFIYTTAENCYIRNNETKTDYEIIKVDGSFASYESEGLYE